LAGSAGRDQRGRWGRVCDEGRDGSTDRGRDGVRERDEGAMYRLQDQTAFPLTATRLDASNKLRGHLCSSVCLLLSFSLCFAVTRAESWRKKQKRGRTFGSTSRTVEQDRSYRTESLQSSSFCLYVRPTRSAIERTPFRPFTSSSSLCFVFSRLKQPKHQLCLLAVRLQPSTSSFHLRSTRCERETLIERRSSNKGSGSVNKGEGAAGNASVGWRDG
jgi:hypothetical protein